MQRFLITALLQDSAQYETLPQCNRLENDETLKFCRVDGVTLVNDSSSFKSEARTAQLGPAMDPLLDDPRFKNLMKRMNL